MFERTVEWPIWRCSECGGIKEDEDPNGGQLLCNGAGMGEIYGSLRADEVHPISAMERYTILAVQAA